MFQKKFLKNTFMKRLIKRMVFCGIKGPEKFKKKIKKYRNNIFKNSNLVLEFK